MKKLLLVLSLVILVSVDCHGEKIYGTSEPSGFRAGLSFNGSTAYIHMFGGKIPIDYKITTIKAEGQPFIFYGEIFKVTCATAANTHVGSNQDKIPKQKPSVEEVAAVEVTVENSYEAPLDKSPEEASNSEIPLTPSRKESPDIKIIDAPAGAKNEDEIIEEEGNGDQTQNLLDTALEFYQASQELWSRGELEEAINALDEAYSLILNVSGESDPAMIQQKEDLRILISRRLIEIYASRYTAVDGNHKAIPLTMNEHVEYEIKQFQTVERNYFINSYKQSRRYIDKIVKELNEVGLPEELAWLPLVESGFNVRAFSPARALGLWQFIASTGYKFGLKRDDWIDERLDPEKSTKAAIAYLQELHHMFGDWTTVLASYNSGEGNVLRVIGGQKINYLDNFWDLYERLPRETARYVPRFLATLHILKEPERYGFDLGETEEPLSFEVVTIEKQVRLDAIAKELGISEALLSDLNPELRLEVTPPTPYSLRIPTAMSEVLLASLDSIPECSRVRTSLAKRHAKSSSELSYVYHRVNKGEILSSIAKRYKTTVAAISKANNIRNRQLIKQGQRLKIPLSGGKVYASKSAETYTVKDGDSLWLIAQKFNTDVDTLKRINNLKFSNIVVGQIIKVMD
jgi:membrane-bound lytic murein transglycosylase D